MVSLAGTLVAATGPVLGRCLRGLAFGPGRSPGDLIVLWLRLVWCVGVLRFGPKINSSKKYKQIGPLHLVWRRGE